MIKFWHLIFSFWEVSFAMAGPLHSGLCSDKSGSVFPSAWWFMPNLKISLKLRGMVSDPWLRFGISHHLNTTIPTTGPVYRWVLHLEDAWQHEEGRSMETKLWQSNPCPFWSVIPWLIKTNKKTFPVPWDHAFVVHYDHLQESLGWDLDNSKASKLEITQGDCSWYQGIV